ncbi:Ig-like domain-containing protein [Chitinivorax sp. PXF-14]|uniref:Ig-like domain-containing protein n=1 Tax=Chitinivorax sp. PXF-14 TaxID=3230488 RepID=UPI0034678BA4
MTRPPAHSSEFPAQRPFATLALCLLLTACGGGGSGPSPFPDGGGGSGSSGTPKVVASLSSTTFSVDQPATVSAVLTDANGRPVANEIVTFSADAALVKFSPASGTVLTDASGTARIGVSPVDIKAQGAARITVSASVGSSTVTQSLAYQIGATSIQLGALQLGTAALSAYGTTGVSIAVSANGQPVTSPVAVNFHSVCADSGKASLDASAPVANGVASATYTDKGCAATDTITATIDGVAQAQQAGLAVAAPGGVSLQYGAVAPADGVIALKGYGSAQRSESARVTFKLVDAQGNAVAGQAVNFSLSTTAGGLRFDNGNATAQGISNAQGEAVATVLSGSLPTPVRVIASSGGLSTQSSGLSVSTGIADQDSFSLSVEAFNQDAWDVDGVEYKLTVRLADHFNNPVPDGTSVNFISNGGRIGNGSTGTCLTVDSGCNVSLFSQQPRASNGRVQITAYAIGEQSFYDKNGNIVLDSASEMKDVNGNSTSVGEAFLDNNEDRVYTAGVDVPIDFNGNGVYDGPDGQYKGSLCLQSSGLCSTSKLMHVFGQTTVVFSGHVPTLSFAQSGAGYPDLAATPVPVSCSGLPTTVALYARDVNSNILPADSTVTFSKTGDVQTMQLQGVTTLNVGNGAPKPATRALGATIFPFTLARSSELSPAQCTAAIGTTESVTAQIEVKSSTGNNQTFSITLPVILSN